MTFRDIKPTLTFEGPNHPHFHRQFHWHHDGDDFATAKFAGKEMMISGNDDGKTYQLTYLDMAHPTNFTSIDEAKIAASDFGKAVLVHMIKMLGFSEEDKTDLALINL
jgi:hypothetical protein